MGHPSQCDHEHAIGCDRMRRDMQRHFDRRRSGWIVHVMEVELRDYRIRHGHMDEWIRRWTAGVVPLREEAGFQVIGAWADRVNDRFVWLIGYSGADGFDAADDRYYGSAGRASLEPDPAELIEQSSTAMVETVM